MKGWSSLAGRTTLSKGPMDEDGVDDGDRFNWPYNTL